MKRLYCFECKYWVEFLPEFDPEEIRLGHRLMHVHELLDSNPDLKELDRELEYWFGSYWWKAS